jgi:hypothetical protein
VLLDQNETMNSFSCAIAWCIGGNGLCYAMEYGARFVSTKFLSDCSSRNSHRRRDTRESWCQHDDVNAAGAACVTGGRKSGMNRSEICIRQEGISSMGVFVHFFAGIPHEFFVLL